MTNEQIDQLEGAGLNQAVAEAAGISAQTLAILESGILARRYDPAGDWQDTGPLWDEMVSDGARPTMSSSKPGCTVELRDSVELVKACERDCFTAICRAYLKWKASK